MLDMIATTLLCKKLPKSSKQRIPGIEDGPVTALDASLGQAMAERAGLLGETDLRVLRPF